MAKVIVEELKEFYQHFPTVAAIVTSHGLGRDNAMACAWHCPLSRSPALYGVSVSKRRYSYELIIDGKEFGVNFVPFELAELIASVGGSTGRDMDKFESFKIERAEPVKTSVPILKDAYAAYECKLVDHRTYGDHEWFVGEIVCTHLLKEAFTDEEVVDLERVSPPLYLGAELYLAPSRETVRFIDRKVYGERR